MVFVHGEPTWSYLWRKVIPPVLDAGFRCIAPDHAGFGRSDKPTDLGWYSYDRHSELFGALVEAARPPRRDRGRPRLGRADRPPRRGRASRADRPDGDPRHRPVHRRAADVGCVEGVPGLRRADRGPAGLVPGQGRLRPRDARRGRRGLRRPVSEPGVEGGGAGLPADAADLARDARRRRRQAGPGRAARRPAAEALPVGGSRSGDPVRGRRAVRRRGQRPGTGEGRATPRTSSRRTPARRSAAGSPSGWRSGDEPAALPARTPVRAPSPGRDRDLGRRGRRHRRRRPIGRQPDLGRPHASRHRLDAGHRSARREAAQAGERDGPDRARVDRRTARQGEEPKGDRGDGSLAQARARGCAARSAR